MKNFLSLLFLTLSNIALADFHAANDAYHEGKYQEAYESFLSMAKTGEKRSQFNIGVMYYQGQYLTKDINKSYAWIKLAVDSETAIPSQLNIFKTVKSEVTDTVQAELEYKLLTNRYSTVVLLEQLYPEFVSIEGTSDFTAKPIKIVNPKYPKKAAKKSKQGWTRFVFDLDKKGIPRNIQLVESFPGKLFVKSSRNAIKKWTFEPAMDKNGQAIAKKNLNYKMVYRLRRSEQIRLKDDVYDKVMALALEDNARSQFKIGVWEKTLNVSEGKENPNEWFLKAAIQGHPAAQFELGRSLVFGQGCILDKRKGIEWLTRSAHNGQSAAKQLLSRVVGHTNNLESHLSAVEYLKGLDDLSVTTQLHHAWLLATSPFKEVADPKEALSIVSEISSLNFEDDISLYEIKAAAYAAMGKFEKAIDYQEDALEEAEDRNADLDSIKTHLASYQANKKWF